MRADSPAAARYRAIPAALPSSGPCGPPSPWGRLCLHQFLQYRILHDHPGGRQAEHLSVPHGVPVPDALPHKDALCRRKPSVEELAQEGAIQIFRELGAGMESVIVGVVGVLQFEVLERRLKAEYRVEVRRQPLPYTDIRWIQNDPDTIDIPGLSLTRDTLRVEDMRGGKLLLFTSPWNVDWATDHNPDLILSEFGNVAF